MYEPVFIIGCPRSGTTLTLHIMAFHEQFAWVSNLLNDKPINTKISILNKIYDLSIIGKHLYVYKTHSKNNSIAKKIYKLPYLGDQVNPTNNKNREKLYRKIKTCLPKPIEPWGFWNYHLSKFQWKRNGSIPPKRRTDKDISIEEIQNIRKIIYRICKYQNKRRFLSKYTELPRIAYLTKAFPHARFIHVVRDGRAAVSSYFAKMENNDFKTWDEREWWIKGWPKEWRDKWLKNYNTPLSFAAYLWKFCKHEIETEINQFRGKCIEVDYEDIINQPYTTFKKIFKFCGMGSSQRVNWYLNNITLMNMNEKWKKKFTNEEKKLLEDIISE